MENDKGRIYYATGLDNSRLREDAAQARNILAGVGTSAAKEGDRIDAAMKKIGASIAGVFAVQQVKDFAVQVATVRGQFQQLEAAFKVLTGDAAVAENLMSQLIHTAATTPFGVTDISNAARQLLAYGVEADKVNETLIRLGDICAGLSIPIGDLAYLYGTTMTQGRLYTADLNQFLGRGIPLADELAKQFGVAKEEIKKMVEDGKVGFPEVQQAIISLTNEGGKFGGLMEAKSKTITGRISNIEDAVEQMFNEIGQSSEGVIGMTLDGITAVVENWEKIGKVLLTVIAAYGLYKGAVIAVAAAHKLANFWGAASAVLSLAKSVTSAKDAMLLFNMAVKANPLGLVLGVVGAAATAFALFSDNTGRATDMTGKYGESAAEAISRVETLTLTLKGLTEGTATHRKVVEELNGILEEYGLQAIKEGDSIDAVNAKRAQAIELIKQEGVERQRANALSQISENYASGVEDAFKTLQSDLASAMSGGTGFIAHATYNEELQKNSIAISNAVRDAVERNITEIAGKTGEEYQKGLDKIYATIQERMRAMGISEKTIAEVWVTDGLFNHQNIIQRYIDTLRQETETKDTNTDATNRLADAERDAAEGALSFSEKVAAIEKGLQKPTEGVHELYENIKRLMSQYSENTIGFTIHIGGEVPKWMEGKSLPELQRLAKFFTAVGQSSPKGSYIGGKYFSQRQLFQHGADYATAAKRRKTKEEEDAKDAREAARKQREAAAKRQEQERRQIADQTAERTRQIEEYKESVIAANAEAELEIRQHQIDNMDDGYEKQKEQIKLNYDRLIAENKKREQDMIDALADAKVLEWQNAHPKATKAETIAYRASLNLTVTDLAPEQREQIEAYNDLALKAMIKGNRQLAEQQEAAWNEYYAKYGDYMQRRNAIAAKYDAELLKAGSGSAEEASLLKQKAEELDALDEEMRGSTTLMGQLFADASERSVAEIQKIIDKAELLMDWLGAQKDAEGAATIDGKTVTRGDILGLGVSENTLQGLERSPEKVESLRNGIARLKGELGSRSPFKRLEEDIKAASAAIKSGDEAEGVAKIGSAVSAFAPALSEFGQSLGTIFGSDELGAKISGVADAVGGLGETAAGVGQIMSGDVVGGAMAAVNGIGKVAGALDGLFGADYSEYEALKGQYDQLTEIWDDLIAKKKEYIDIDYGAEAQKAGQEALDLLEKEAEATRNLLAARGSSGSGLFTNSIAARTNDDLGGWLAELRKYTHVQDMAVFQTLQNSTADELEKIKEEMPEFWARLDYATQDYLEKLIAIEEQRDEVVESMKEATTGLSFDSFYDGYVDMLADLDADNEDFADSFGEYMRKSILASLMSNVYRDELQKLYNKWAELGEDGYTEDEVSYLQNWAKSVSDRMLAERDKMAETFGWESEDGDTREASAKGIATASQDSVDELNGRATAIQGHTYSISENTKLLLSTANMILQSVLNIESNTDGMSSRMETVEGDVREVRNTLNDIALKGVRIR